MLRRHIAQQCFGLSDEGIEDAIYDSQSIRGFGGIDLTHELAPDATATAHESELFRNYLSKWALRYYAAGALRKLTATLAASKLA